MYAATEEQELRYQDLCRILKRFKTLEFQLIKSIISDRGLFINETQSLVMPNSSIKRSSVRPRRLTSLARFRGGAVSVFPPFGYHQKGKREIDSLILRFFGWDAFYLAGVKVEKESVPTLSGRGRSKKVVDSAALLIAP